MVNRYAKLANHFTGITQQDLENMIGEKYNEYETVC
jgi:hypothetical protein